MLRLTQRQRELLLDKWPDLANLAVAGLVFGQFLGTEPFSWRLAVGGLLVWMAISILMLALAKERL